MSYNEAGTRTKIIGPRLYQVGWSEDSITHEIIILKEKVYLVDLPRGFNKIIYSLFFLLIFINLNKNSLEVLWV